MKKRRDNEEQRRCISTAYHDGAQQRRDKPLVWLILIAGTLLVDLFYL